LSQAVEKEKRAKTRQQNDVGARAGGHGEWLIVDS
jgi:hypothetical protein